VRKSEKEIFFAKKNIIISCCHVAVVKTPYVRLKQKKKKTVKNKMSFFARLK
jgi:hypothetical protein